MSWQDYVNNNLLGTNTCKHAIIAGLDGNIWAEGGNLQGKVTPAELKMIISGFNDPSGFQANGARIAGEKYIFIGGDGSTVLRFKMGAGGAVTVKTATAILLVTYDDTIQPGQCSNIVEKLGEYLRSVQY